MHLTIYVPHGSGWVFNLYTVAEIDNDRLRLYKKPAFISGKDTFAPNYQGRITPEFYNLLKQVLIQLDTPRILTNFCQTDMMGWPRFMFFPSYRGIKNFVILSNVYEKKMLDVIDVMNRIVPGGLIQFNMDELLKSEADFEKEQRRSCWQPNRPFFPFFAHGFAKNYHYHGPFRRR